MNNVLRGTDPSASRLVEAIAGSSGTLVDQRSSSNAASPPAATDNTGQTGAHPQETAVESSGDMTISPSLPANSTGNGSDSGDTTSAAPVDSLSSALDLSGLGLSGLGLAGDDSNLDLAGNGTTLQPILNAANSAILETHAELEVLSHQTGTAFIVHGVTNLGEAIGLGKIGIAPEPDGHANLLTDVLNAPADLLGGDLDGVISNLGHDLQDVLGGVFALKDSVIFGPDPINPIPELINSLGGDLSTLPLLTINGGNNTEGGGLLGGIVGDLSHSSSGHLIDADVGHPQDDRGLVLDILSANDPGPRSPVAVDAVDVGPNGPQLLDLGLLTDGSFALPNLGGTTTDSLLGGILTLDSASSAAPSDGVPALGGLNIASVVPEQDLTSILDTNHGVLDLHGTHLI